MNYRSYKDLSQCIWKNLYKIPSDTDLIVGVKKTGLLIALIISKFTNIPVTSIDQFLQMKILNSGNYSFANNQKNFQSIKNVLVVDDSIYSGRTIREIKKQIKITNLFNDKKIKYLSVYYLNNQNFKDIDIGFEQINNFRFFQWNFLFHPLLLSNCCMDIDGIICRNPTEQENDDGKNYLNFIKNVPFNFYPSHNSYISCFVTCRLQKYRKETEEWLHKRFKYNSLIMLNLSSKEERQKLNMYGKFKGQIYKSRPQKIFIESSKQQSIEILKISKKQIFCTETMELLKP